METISDLLHGPQARDALLYKQKRLGNCARLGVVQVSQEIFSTIKRPTRSNDFLLKKIQQNLLSDIKAILLPVNHFVLTASGAGEAPIQG